MNGSQNPWGWENIFGKHFHPAAKRVKRQEVEMVRRKVEDKPDVDKSLREGVSVGDVEEVRERESKETRVKLMTPLEREQGIVQGTLRMVGDVGENRTEREELRLSESYVKIKGHPPSVRDKERLLQSLSYHSQEVERGIAKVNNPWSIC